MCNLSESGNAAIYITMILLFCSITCLPCSSKNSNDRWTGSLRRRKNYIWYAHKISSVHSINIQFNHASINSTDYFKGGLNHEDVSFLFIVIKEFMLVNCIDSRTTRSTLLASVRLTVWHEKRCCWVKHTVYLNGNYICLVSTFSSTRYSCTIYKFKKYSLHWVPQPFRSLHDDKNSH